MLKIPPFILALGALAVFATGCGTDHAKVRFVHAAPPPPPPDTQPNLDVAVDGKTVASDMAFGDVFPAADYLTVAAGNRRVEVRDTGNTNDRINSTVDFASQKVYTLLVSGKISDKSIAAVLKTDDNTAPPSGSIKLRVIHDSPGGPGQIDVYVVAPGTDITTVTPVISNLSYQQASVYEDLPAATYEVVMTSSGAPADVRFDGTFPLAAGQVRTLVTLDIGGSGQMSALELSDLN